MLKQNEKSEGSEIGIMDVLYISPASPRTPARFPPPPGCLTVRPTITAHTHRLRAADRPGPPQPGRRALYMPIVHRSWNFGTFPTLYRHIAQRHPQNRAKPAFERNKNNIWLRSPTFRPSLPSDHCRQS